MHLGLLCSSSPPSRCLSSTRGGHGSGGFTFGSLYFPDEAGQTLHMG